MQAEVRGCKMVELPYLEKQIDQVSGSVLIVGERGGGEGIIEVVMTRNPSAVVCTDMMECPEGSIVDNLRKADPRVTFEQGDLIKFDESRKFDYIVCINVLEHFGMNFGDRPMFSGEFYDDDVIKWNYDLKGLIKMMKLLKDYGSRLIVTVPCGVPLMHGDLSITTGLPYLRRYDRQRIELIHQLIHKEGCFFTEQFFWTGDFQEWRVVDEKVTWLESFQHHNPTTPNAIWAFTIEKS
jgi:hypothetical protein